MWNPSCTRQDGKLFKYNGDLVTVTHSTFEYSEKHPIDDDVFLTHMDNVYVKCFGTSPIQYKCENDGLYINLNNIAGFVDTLLRKKHDATSIKRKIIESRVQTQKEEEEEINKKIKILKSIERTHDITYQKQQYVSSLDNNSLAPPCILITCNTEFFNDHIQKLLPPSRFTSIFSRRKKRSTFTYRQARGEAKEGEKIFTYINDHPIDELQAKQVLIEGNVYLWDFLEDVWHNHQNA